jgi:uroporphyrin-III C-methyltransferase / precorrin-2 dehydrogenase / sirohydrochlorin ferrochelatase
MSSKAPLHPIFLDLDGRDVLVVGAGEVGLRKAREFVECGANLRVVSPEFHAGFSDLEGRYRRLQRHWRPGDEGGARLVVAATSDPATNRAVYAVCSQRGILCNVADVPDLCDWQAAAVARSGPVQIAVSTHGAAPSLASHARREMQDWLAEGFSDLVDIYARLRGEFRSTMLPGARERFWKELDVPDLLDILRTRGAEACESRIRELAGDRDRPQDKFRREPGRVVLVGAGPGHPDLITRLGLRMLGRATALVHDRLVAPELLRAVPTSCRVFPVGKTGFGESHKQEDINALLVRLAREGHLVVRLKGGDPFVFGRGGEEIEACAAAGIPVEVVPGVSSSLAAAAWRGIPITHRGLSRSFAVVSAFHADGTAARIPDVETVVVMMPLHSMGSVQARFAEAGWDPSTPCAAIQAATTDGEREVLATLSDLDARIREAGLRSPILVVVGAVVGWAAENRGLLDHVLTAARRADPAE